MMITPKSTNASRWMRMALLAVLATTAASCNNEMPEAGINPEKQNEKMTLHVGTGQKAPETRVAYDDNKVDNGQGNTLTWQKGDRLAVALTYKGNCIDHMHDYEYKGEDGATYGTFEGTKIDLIGGNWAVYYPNTVKINADGTATLPMTGQTQTANGDTKHLRNYMLMAATGLKSLTGGFDLEMQSSIMKFDLSDIPAEVGMLKKLMWMVEADGETKSIVLDFAPGAVNFGSSNSDRTLTAFLSFMPQEMKVKDGGKFSVMLIGDKSCLAETTVSGGKSYEAGKRYTAKFGSADWQKAATMAITVNVEDNDLGFFIPFDDSEAPANITVDWGDGSISTVASGTNFFANRDFSHTYSVADTYTITIISDKTDEAQKQIPKMSFFNWTGTSEITNNTLKLISVDTPLLNMGETNLYFCFQNCTNLQSIPEGLFANNKEATTFMGCFQGCTNLQSIPEGLFEENKKVTDFSRCFIDCTNLQSIPKKLFISNKEATDFSYCFQGCTNLQSIPKELFENNPEATTFSSCFYYCTNLQSISEGLFENNPEATNFSSCFFYCINLTLNEKIFVTKEPLHERFKGKSMDFTSCFQGVGVGLNSGVAGTAPDLWKYTGHETWQTARCFTGANKTLSNWGEITKAWGGDQPDN